MPRKANDGKGRLGGRKKGTPNKRTQELQEKAEELGVDPFEVLLLFAKGDYKQLGYDKHIKKATPAGPVNELSITPELRMQSAEKACQYLFPKRKAVDVTSQGDQVPAAVYFVEHKPKKKK